MAAFICIARCSCRSICVILFLCHCLIFHHSRPATAADFDTYIVLLHGSPLLHYDGSLPELPPPPLRPNGRPDSLSTEAQKFASFLSDRHDNLLRSVAEDPDTYYSTSDVDAARTNLTVGQRNSGNLKLYSYHYLINGFAARMTTEQADAMRNKEGVVRVEKDGQVRKWTTYTPEWMGLEAKGGAWAEATPRGAAGAGEGVVIGFVDTGIDPTHPSFSDKTTASGGQNHPYGRPAHFTGACEFTAPPSFTQHSSGTKHSCNNKLLAARRFSAAIVASGLLSSSSPDNTPFDGDGHGTHTASTAAGNAGVPVHVNGLYFGTASGIAPRAHIAIYKSMFRDVGGYFSDTVAAMDQAVQDGVDILNLSIGPAEPPSGLATFFSAMEVAALSAVKAGVFVVQAAGNSGPAPGTVASFSPWVFTVGAACHNRVYQNRVVLRSLTEGTAKLSFDSLGLSPGTKGETFYQLITAEDAVKKDYNWYGGGNNGRRRRAAAACQNAKMYDKKAVEGRILVCSYTQEFVNGDASIKTVLSTAAGLSAAGVIVTVETATASADLGQFPSSLPAVLIPSITDAQEVLAYIRSSNNATVPAAARIMGGLEATYVEREAEVASYSSRGPDLANDRREVAEIMKPDVMAPGEMIWAAWSPTGDEDDNFAGSRFALASGTSMAAPHVAGVAALVKQKHPWMGPAAIASALTTTASTIDRKGKPLLAQRPSANSSRELGAATPFDFGGGELNANEAMHPGLVFDAEFHDYVEALCGIRGAAVEVLHSTGAACGPELDVDSTPTSRYRRMGDLNKPSVTVANLTAERTLRRVARRVPDGRDVEGGPDEVYEVRVEAEPEGVAVKVRPTMFRVGAATSGSCPWWNRALRRSCADGDRLEAVELFVTLTPRSSSGRPSFGSILLSGSRGHNVRIPVSVISRWSAGGATP